MSMSFDESCPWGESPVVISVPHAGRAYDAAIIGALAVPLDAARPLEDRYADLLASIAARQGHHVVIARTPRLVIDLNRAETDFDPSRVTGAAPRLARPSARARGGLGLIPDRLVGAGDLWRARPTVSELAGRIATIHRPYHTAIAAALERARSMHGYAMLIDLHSMPTLTDRHIDVVIGDRFGQCARYPVRTAALEVLRRAGLHVALNAPYAGGHIVERHASRERRIDALQLEFDRRLYLDARLDEPGGGLEKIARVVADISAAISSTRLGDALDLAAE